MLLRNNILIHWFSSIWIRCQLFCGGQNTNGPDDEGLNTEGPNTKDPNTEGPDSECPYSECLNTEGPSPRQSTIQLSAMGPVVPMWNNYVKPPDI